MSHYDVLEVSPNASPEVIRAAYRSLMQRYHPDKNPGKADIAERAARIAHAYDVLSDPGKRAAYDVRLGQLSNPMRAQHVEAAPGRRARAEKSNAHYTYLAVVVVLGILAGWYMLSPSRRQQAPEAEVKAIRSWLDTALSRAGTQRSPQAELRAIRLSFEGRRLTASELQERSSRIAEILGENPDLRREYEKDMARAVQARTIAAYVSNLAVSLQEPGPDGRQRVLSIPVLDVVVGSFDSEKLMDHLTSNNDFIARKLAEKLAHARYEELVRRGKELHYLKTYILDSFGEVTGTRRDEEFPSSYAEAPGRYGVVDVVFPKDFSVQ
jgi:curved DNA-binding protein CbpA